MNDERTEKYDILIGTLAGFAQGVREHSFLVDEDDRKTLAKIAETMSRGEAPPRDLLNAARAAWGRFAVPTTGADEEEADVRFVAYLPAWAMPLDVLNTVDPVTIAARDGRAFVDGFEVEDATSARVGTATLPGSLVLSLAYGVDGIDIEAHDGYAIVQQRAEGRRRRVRMFDAHGQELFYRPGEPLPPAVITNDAADLSACELQIVGVISIGPEVELVDTRDAPKARGMIGHFPDEATARAYAESHRGVA